MALTSRTLLQALHNGLLPSLAPGIVESIRKELSCPPVVPDNPVNVSSLDDGKWHHVGFTISTTDRSRLYFDRQEVDAIENLDIIVVGKSIYLEYSPNKTLIALSKTVSVGHTIFSAWYIKPKAETLTESTT